MKRRIFLSGLLACACWTAPASAGIEALLNADEAPPGVVFEIVEGRDDALSWALPLVEAHAMQLRARFPGLKIAVVSHGAEQFGLATGYQGAKARKIREAALEMTQAGTKLHVCGAYANTRGLSAADFPAHVDVAASGPAQVSALIGQGYVLVQLRRR